MFRRGDIKRSASQLIDVFLDFVNLSAKLLADLLQVLRVDTHAVGFHATEHGHKRHFDFIEQLLHAVLFQQGQQLLIELQCDVGILGGIFLDQFHRHLAHRLLLTAFANQFLDGNGDVVKVDLGEVVHVVALLGFDEVMRQHGVKELSSHANAVLRQHRDVVFQVLPNLKDAFVFK